MCSYLRSFAVFFIPFLFLKCSTPKAEKEFFEEEKTIVAGKIINYDPEVDPFTVAVYFRDFLTREKEYAEFLNENGEFRVEHVIAYPQEFYIIYNNRASLYCLPGDSIYVEIDADIFNNSDSNPFQKYFTNVVYGASKQFNHELNDYYSTQPYEAYSFKNANDAVKHKSPEEYIAFLDKRDSEYKHHYDSIKRENPSLQFQNLVEDQLKYNRLNDLMRYSWYHPSQNRIPQDSFELPSNYFQFLETYDSNDLETISIVHQDFLDELYFFSIRTPKDSLKKAQDLIQIKRDTLGSLQMIKNMIKINTSGLTRELFLTRHTLEGLQRKDIKSVESLYDSAEIYSPYFQMVINKEYNKAKDYLANKNTKKARLISIKSDITDGLIDEISSKYKDKVIYIDFWATWCKPCMEEMPYSKELQDHFAGEDVVFLYLASKCKKDVWKSTIANEKMAGEHILLTDDQMNVLSNHLGISGIPHYTLIDKEGNIVLKSAPRPSSKEAAVLAIKKLL